MAFNWTCPYCNRPQTVTSKNYSTGDIHFYTVDPDIGPIGLSGSSVVCSNPDCRKATVTASIVHAKKQANGVRYFPNVDDTYLLKRLAPDSAAKPQPEFIPAAIRNDYEEACKICDLSPKAAATLARRCLQGMIRNFCGVAKGRLVDEINELQALLEKDSAPKGVSEESIEAINHVRSIGNIGAHMERDINVIVDVDPDEAKLLIELIETLFDEWYVERNKRQERFARVRAIAEDKKKQITAGQKNLLEPPKTTE